MKTFKFLCDNCKIKTNFKLSLSIGYDQELNFLIDIQSEPCQNCNLTYIFFEGAKIPYLNHGLGKNEFESIVNTKYNFRKFEASDGEGWKINLRYRIIIMDKRI